MRRLQTRPQFQTVLAGPVLAKSPHFALHCLDWSGSAFADQSRMRAHPELVMGALLPKRWAKRAVTRNTIKRQIFAVAEQFESRLAHFAYVVRLRCAMDRAHFVSASSNAMKAALREEISALFTQGVTRIPATRHA